MAAYSIPIVRASADLDGTSERAHQLQSVEKYQQSDAKGSGKLPSLVIQTADIRTVADLFSYVKQKDKQFHPKPASKVVNDDGTPMVVYHGTSDTFWAFDVNEIRHLEGNYFFAQKRAGCIAARRHRHGCASYSYRLCYQHTLAAGLCQSVFPGRAAGERAAALQPRPETGGKAGRECTLSAARRRADRPRRAVGCRGRRRGQCARDRHRRGLFGYLD